MRTDTPSNTTQTRTRTTDHGLLTAQRQLSATATADQLSSTSVDESLVCGKLATGGSHVNRPHIKINAGRSQLTVTGMVDTGSNRMLMDYDTWARLVSQTKINCEYKLGPSPLLVTLTGTPIDIKGTVNIYWECGSRSSDSLYIRCIMVNSN